MSTPSLESGLTKRLSAAALNPGFSERQLYINSVGQTIITSLTIIGSSYLLYALLRQGHGKLRVRLLLGMIFGDLLLGVGAFIPNIWALSGGRFVTGTAGCDAFGFIYTSILFSQHLYTLAIAIATFLLLKYPLSPLTYWVERNSMWAMPFIWAMSFAHAAGWWVGVGWSMSGPLCYYAPKPISDNLDARDLVQFIPRALVFLTIIILYSMLYKFLRRPDTIQLSSQFVSGETGTNKGVGGKKKGVMSGLKWKSKLNLASQNGRGATEHSASKIDPAAPWEQLEFVKVGGRDLLSPLDNGIHFSPTPSIGGLEPPPTPQHRGSITSIYLGTNGNGTRTPDFSVPTTRPHRPSLNSSNSSSSETNVPLSTSSSSRPSQSETLVSSPDSRYPPRQHNLSPVMSQNASNTGPRVDKDIEMDLGPDVVQSLKYKSGDEKDILDEDDDTPGETLGQFFKDDQFVSSEDSRAERGGISHNHGLPQMSATAYFNRQASLLMLYFPLAYMLVFSVSLIRLIYDMVHSTPNPILQIASGWMVLSVGLIDAVVYGVAEFMVKRKVRRKMGDRL